MTTRREFLKQTAGLLVAGTGIGVAAGCRGRNMPTDKIKLPASYYQQFDADFKLDVPGEGYQGWNLGDIEISRKHTALVVMHAWDMGTRAEYPGWHRAVEYIPRADKICRTVFPKLLSAVRESDFKLFHVVGGGDYYRDLAGYKRAVKLTGEEPPALEQTKPDPVLQALNEFRAKHVFVGKHNEADVNRGFEHVGFPPEARPLGDEGIAENAHQLHALCRDSGVNHLIYAGFAINWCLLASSGGMLDMSRRGYMCSAVRDATTAVENRESARTESHKEEALWRVALAYGFVFDADSLIKAFHGG